MTRFDHLADALPRYNRNMRHESDGRAIDEPGRCISLTRTAAFFVMSGSAGCIFATRVGMRRDSTDEEGGARGGDPK